MQQQQLAGKNVKMLLYLSAAYNFSWPANF